MFFVLISCTSNISQTTPPPIDEIYVGGGGVCARRGMSYDCRLVDGGTYDNGQFDFEKNDKYVNMDIHNKYIHIYIHLCVNIQDEQTGLDMHIA